MADNFQITQGSGTIIGATDTGGGVLEQRIRISTIPSITVSNFPANQTVNIDRTGRTPVLKTATLVTTAVTADQVILTYTVTSGKTFWLQYIAWDVRLTAVSATASIMGAISLESPAGNKVFTATEVNPTTSETAMCSLQFAEPIPISSGTVIRWVTTPAAVTSMTWIGNFGGYEL